jgi:hypothetical protein
MFDNSSDELPAARAGALAPGRVLQTSMGIARTDPFGLLNDESSQERLIDDILDSSDDSVESLNVEHLEQLRSERLERATDAFFYPGDLFASIENTHDEARKNWNTLPLHEYHRRWLMEFRMTEPVFLELLEIVSPFQTDTEPGNPSRHRYTKKEKLLVTLNFLAHCPSLRQMAQKWGMPHNSIARIVLHPTVQALRRVLLEEEATRNIRWPKEAEDQRRVMQGFRNRFQLPGCIGAIDGSLIPQRKPTKEQANQDTDSYYGYKGGIASLLLAVCDADLRLLYVNAGAPVWGMPGCLGAHSSKPILMLVYCAPAQCLSSLRMAPDRTFGLI